LSPLFLSYRLCLGLRSDQLYIYYLS
jgi:hypothetical protein